MHDIRDIARQAREGEHIPARPQHSKPSSLTRPMTQHPVTPDVYREWLKKFNGGRVEITRADDGCAQIMRIGDERYINTGMGWRLLHG